ncbi:MAG: hypothetical protein JNJ73_20210 [Hyphomonadaceae bacterium]|nr:hypothetical protein [Hyphomonadaceae bacterium]
MIRFNFYAPGRSPEELARFKTSKLTDINPPDLKETQETVTLQAFLVLKERMEGCELSTALDPDAINIAATIDLPRLPPPGRPFMVAARADAYPRYWADLEMVHNKGQLKPGAFWMPHFPQLGLIPRDPARGSTFTTIGYMGRPINYIAFKGLFRSGFVQIAEEVDAICKRLGLKLVMKGADSWHDNSDIDAVVGIRDFTGNLFKSKPAVKLFNAWAAGVPFIGGPDSAFLESGEPEWNYLRIFTAQDLEKALTRLQGDADLRKTLVERGKVLSTQYGLEQTAQRWMSLLKGAATERFLEQRDARAQPDARRASQKS